MYAIGLTEISPYSWGVIIFLAIVNFIRIKALHSPHHVCRIEDHDTGHAAVHHDDDHASYPTSAPAAHPHFSFVSSVDDHGDDTEQNSGHGDDDGLHLTTSCADYEMNYFIFCGFLLTLLITIIAYITWKSECKLLEIAMTRLVKDDYGKHSSYGKILKALAVLEAKKALLAQQKSTASMTNQPPPLISGNPSDNSCLPSDNTSVKPEDVFEDDIRDLLDESHVYHIVTLRVVLKDLKHEEEVEHIKREFERKEFIKRIYHNICCCFLSSSDNEIENKKYRISELKEKEKKLESLENKFRETSGRQGEGMSVRYSIKKAKGESLKRPPYSTDSDDESDDEPTHEHELTKETNNIFLFSDRILYKRMIEISLMLFALYTSLWVSHFIVIGSASSHENSYLIIVSASIIFIFILISYIQYHSNMILAATSLCNENAEWICNQDYVKSKTLPLLRNEIKEMLTKLSKTEFEEAIKEIFYLVNMDGDEKILLDEFATLLYTLDIHLTHAETRVLFRFMDMDGK